MKKKLSAAGLALRLTLREFLAVVAATALLQFILFVRQDIYYETRGFEWLLDEMGVALSGSASAWVLMGLLLLRCGNRKTSYTIRRLGLKESSLTVLWGGVFAGYFLLLWAAQLLTVLGLLAWYGRTIPLDPIDWFVASYRSGYFHFLLPLGEWMGYVRNGALCLCYGAMAAMLARQMRHGGKPWMAAVLLFLHFLIPTQMASQSMDALLCGLLAGCVVIQWYINREVSRSED